MAVAVYEESIRLGVYARHSATLSTSLPVLIRQLLPALRADGIEEGHELASAITQLSLSHSNSEIPDRDKQSYYTALYLVHILSSTRSLPEFWSTFADLTVRSRGVYTESLSVSLTADRHIQFARSIAIAYQRIDWVTFGKLQQNSNCEFPLLHMLAAQLGNSIRDMTWIVLLRSYMSLPRSRLSSQLLIDSSTKREDDLDHFLSQKEWTGTNKVSQDTVMLKNAK